MIGLNSTISHASLLEIIEAISKSESIEELIGVGKALASVKLGLYHLIPVVGAKNYDQLNRFWTTGLDQIVHDYLKLKSKRSDPPLKFTIDQGRPYWMSDLLMVEQLSGGRERHRINLALEFLGDGLLVPLFGPYHRIGYVYLGFNSPKEFFDDVYPWQVQAILQAAHIRYCILVESLKTSVRLTDRESEVLELITFGKTNPEIGIILGISTSTVSGHVKRIFLKFDAKDRVTVALRAQSFIR